MDEAGRTYITLDDQTALEAARADPSGSFAAWTGRSLTRSARAGPPSGDQEDGGRDYRPGRFLLTGSANVLTLPRVADSLAGRMETLRMLPLSRAEIRGAAPHSWNASFQATLEGDKQAMSATILFSLR